MQQVLVAGRLLKRVTERVTKVEAHALARFAFVGGNDAALPPAGALHDLGEGAVVVQRWVTGHQSRSRLLENGEEAHITEQGNLYRLCRGCDQLANGKGAQRGKIRDHCLRLMECANEILPLGKINPSLAAE